MLKELLFPKPPILDLDAEIARVSQRKQEREEEIAALDRQIDAARDALDRIATRRLLGDVTAADAEAAHAKVSTLTAQRASAAELLNAIRHELAHVDEARAETRRRARLAAKTELLPRYHTAVRESANALKAAQQTVKVLVELRDQLEQRCSDPATGSMRDAGIDGSVLGLGEAWRDDFLARPECRLDMWLADVRAHHVPGV